MTKNEPVSFEDTNAGQLLVSILSVFVYGVAFLFLIGLYSIAMISGIAGVWNSHIRNVFDMPEISMLQALAMYGVYMCFAIVPWAAFKAAQLVTKSKPKLVGAGRVINFFDWMLAFTAMSIIGSLIIVNLVAVIGRFG